MVSSLIYITWIYSLSTQIVYALNSHSYHPLHRLFHPHHWAFHSCNSRGRRSSPSSLSLSGSTAGDVAPLVESNRVWKESDVSSDIEQQGSSSTELWLDLRGTAISPRVALHHLLIERPERKDAMEDDDISNKPRRKLNRVLVSHLNEQELQKQSVTNDMQIMPPVQEMISDGFLVLPDETEQSTTDYVSLMQLVPTSYASQTYAGELILMKDEINLVHPIPAMICLERGGWVVLDPSQIAEESDRMESVTHIVNLLSGSLPSSLQVGTTQECESSWLVNGETDNLGGGTSGGGGGGGIAVVCSSNQDVFNFAHLIESLRSQNDSSITARASGILTVSSSEKHPSPADRKVKRKLATALVLPFDVGLWETLSLFIQQSSF